jgi:hypothetical protein
MTGVGRGLIAALSLMVLGSSCRRAEAPSEAAASATSPPETAKSTPEPEPELPPLPKHAVLDEAIRAARESAQRRLLRGSEEPMPDLPPLPEGPLPGADQPLPPEGLPGLFVPLELPEDAEPLAPFEAALAELEAGTRTTAVRVAVYGASGVAADMWTGYLRAYLQARFGDGGPGIVAGAPPHRWSHHQEIAFDASKHWNIRNTFRLDELAPAGRFGVMGQAMSVDNPRAWSQLEPRPDSPSAESLAFYEIHYLRQRGGGRFAVKLDGEPVAEIDTGLDTAGSAPHAPALGRHRVDLEPGKAHTLRIEVESEGQVRLLGVVAETGKPGVVVDALGVNGAKAEDMARWDHELWAEHLKLRDPVLYILAYGNNESVDTDVPIAKYERDVRAMLERFAEVLPEAGCVMLGPGDYPIVEDGEPRPRPRLAKIRTIQQELAPAYGCAFLDTQAIFGGPGSKAAWIEAGLAKDDWLHMTRLGYLRFGMAVGDALMQPWDWRALHEGERG